VRCGQVASVAAIDTRCTPHRTPGRIRIADGCPGVGRGGWIAALARVRRIGGAGREARRTDQATRRVVALERAAACLADLIGARSQRRAAGRPVRQCAVPPGTMRRCRCTPPPRHIRRWRRGRSCRRVRNDSWYRSSRWSTAHPRRSPRRLHDAVAASRNRDLRHVVCAVRIGKQIGGIDRDPQAEGAGHHVRHVGHVQVLAVEEGLVVVGAADREALVGAAIGVHGALPPRALVVVEAVASLSADHDVGGRSDRGARSARRSGSAVARGPRCRRSADPGRRRPDSRCSRDKPGSPITRSSGPRFMTRVPNGRSVRPVPACAHPSATSASLTQAPGPSKCTP